MRLTRPVSRSGNDPLIDEESNHDINSVAGVLKLYFRGLENPLFPKDRFNDLISCVREYHSMPAGGVRQCMCTPRGAGQGWKHGLRDAERSGSSLTNVSPATLQAKLIPAACVRHRAHYLKLTT